MSKDYVLRKRVNLSSESSQLISYETVNQIRTGRQVLNTRPKGSQPYSGKGKEKTRISYNLTTLQPYKVRFHIEERNINYNII